MKTPLAVSRFVPDLRTAWSSPPQEPFVTESFVQRLRSYLDQMFGLSPPAQLHFAADHAAEVALASGVRARQGGGQFALYGTLAHAAQEFVDGAVWAQTPGVVFQLQMIGVYLPPALQDFAQGFERTPRGAVLAAARARLLQSAVAGRLDVQQLSGVRVEIGAPAGADRLDAVDTLFDSAVEVQRQPVQVVFFGEPVPAAAPTKMFGAAHALEVQLPGKDASRRVEEFPCVIGRAHDANLHVDNELVSRVHAVILEDAGGQLVLEDRSVHGTFLEGERIGCGKRRPLGRRGQFTLLAPDEQSGGIALHFREPGSRGQLGGDTPVDLDASTPMVRAPAPHQLTLLHVRSALGLESASVLRLPHVLEEGTTRLVLRSGGAVTAGVVTELERGSVMHAEAAAPRVFLWRRAEKVTFPSGAVAWFDLAAATT